MDNVVKSFRKILKDASPKSIVFFGGAGVSTESGIPNFRSKNGLYKQKFKYKPEYMLSRSCFEQHMKDFFDFYYSKVLYLEAKPNAAHKKLTELEQEGKLISVITQNIDGLHQMAKSKVVYELHGSILRNYCMSCNYFADGKKMLNLRDKNGIPRCPECNGIIKPDVVLYEEPLDSKIMYNAINSIISAEIMIIAGTSLVVYPAANLINYFHGKKLIVVNKQATSADKKADLVIQDNIGKLLDY